MVNISKQKLLFVTALLTVLLISSTYTVLSLPSATANPTTSDKTLSFMRDVLKLDMSKYQVSLQNVSGTPSKVDNSSLLDLIALPTERLTYSLDSDNSKLTANCGFINDSLTSCVISANVGLPIYAQPSTSLLNLAKGILERYWH